jgi:hypothetical protein
LNFKPENGKSASIPATNYFAPDQWEVCRDYTNEAFGRDKHIESVTALKYISSSIKVLLYSGEFDLNTNLLGTMRVLEQNKWNGGHSWSSAVRSLWLYGGDVAGEYFYLGKYLSYLIVRKSGHLLPMDLPDVALEMLRRFISDETFADVLLASDDYYKLKVVVNKDDKPSRLRLAEEIIPGNAWLVGLLIACVALTSGLAMIVFRKAKK